MAILGQQAADTALGDLAHDVALLRQQSAVALQQRGVVGAQGPRRRASDKVAPEVGGSLAHFQRRIRDSVAAACGSAPLVRALRSVPLTALTMVGKGLRPAPCACPAAAPRFTSHGEGPFEKTNPSECGCAKIFPGARIAGYCCGSVNPPLPRRAAGIAEAAVLARGLAVVARRAQRLQVARDVVVGKEIAAQEGIDNSYISRVVNLTTLAPDIVAAMLDDELPNHVTLFDLAVDPPALWDELGFRVEHQPASAGDHGPPACQRAEKNRVGIGRLDDWQHEGNQCGNDVIQCQGFKSVFCQERLPLRLFLCI